MYNPTKTKHFSDSNTTHLYSAQSSSIVSNIPIKQTADKLQVTRRALEVANQHGRLDPSPEAPLSGRVTREVTVLNSEVVVAQTTADVQVGPAPKRGGKILHEGAILNKRGDIFHRLLDKDTQAPSATEKDIVV